MEHFIRMAFWILTFSVTPSRFLPITLSDFNIDLMKEQVKCEDSEFYTPEVTADGKCYTSALECIYIELKGVAQLECEDPQRRIEQGLEMLEFKIKELKEKDNVHAPTNSGECACEKWEQRSFIKFLDNYESWLQWENNAPKG